MSALDEEQKLWYTIVKFFNDHPLQWVSALPTYTAPPDSMDSEQLLLRELVGAVNHNV